MADYPQTVLDFNACFHAEAACRAYWESFRWPNGPRCPRCPPAKVWKMKAAFYRCAACGHDFTVRAGPLFADPPLPLRLGFQALWYVVNQKHGARALGGPRVLGFGSYRTAWNWLDKLRRAMGRPGRAGLAGTIEMDEVDLGGQRPGQRGRGAAGKALGLGTGTKADACVWRAWPLRRRRWWRKATLAAVSPGSPVWTAGWSGAAGLKTKGNRHSVVRARAVVEANLLPRAKRVAALLQRWLWGTHQGAVAAAHWDYYLDEFTFRFNRRTSSARGWWWQRLVEQALALAPVRGEELVGGTYPKSWG